MPKICCVDGCNNYVWGKGYCKYHQYLRTDKKQKSIKKSYIRPMSEKMEEDYKIYRPLMDEYMSEHKTCEVFGCCRPSNDLHHKKGRTGYADDWARSEGVKLLWDVRWFMAVCRICHNRFDEDPNWARKNEYLI